MASKPAASKPRQQATVQRTWIKNHPLEGDGVVTGFYNFLHKRHAKTMSACPGVLIPDTIVFDHNFPRGWYTTSDVKSKGEITKKQGKELDAASIAQGFSKPQPANAPISIVASYMCSYEEDDKTTGESVTVTSVEFFNEEALKEFVARKTKREGILQRFVAPKGLRNTVIQAVWSPRVCMVQRRTNRGSIKDKIQCERDPYPIAVTYEGPSHFSEEGTCAAHTTQEVKTMCANIASHFYNTEHKYVTRMVLYFKVDEKDQLWLLWCGSLRVSDKDTPSQMPLNLAPKFDSPSLEASSPKKEEASLYGADKKHHELTNDTLFYTTYMKPQDDAAKEAEASQAAAHASQSAASTGANGNVAKSSASNQQREDSEWHKQPGIQRQYTELCLAREAVLSAFDDIFYAAYGHFLRYDPGPYNFEVDKVTAKNLGGGDVLSELMSAVKIEHQVATDDATTTVEDEDHCFTILPGKSGPVKQLGDAVAKWVHAHFDRKEQELKDEAASMPQTQEQEKDEEPAEQPKKAAAAPAKEESAPPQEKPSETPRAKEATPQPTPSEEAKPVAAKEEPKSQEAAQEKEQPKEEQPAATEPAKEEEQPVKEEAKEEPPIVEANEEPKVEEAKPATPPPAEEKKPEEASPKKEGEEESLPWDE
jgi:hypothetical protein